MIRSLLNGCLKEKKMFFERKCKSCGRIIEEGEKAYAVTARFESVAPRSIGFSVCYSGIEFECEKCYRGND